MTRNSISVISAVTARVIHSAIRVAGRLEGLRYSPDALMRPTVRNTVVLSISSGLHLTQTSSSIVRNSIIEREHLELAGEVPTRDGDCFPERQNRRIVTLEGHMQW